MAKPLVLDCGHTFCENCVHTIQSGPIEGRKCPTCRARNVAKASTNVALANLYDSLKAKCLNEGCTWLGTVAQHAIHSHSCESKIIACKHQTCEKAFKRSLLQQHMAACPCRPTTCTACKVAIPQNCIDEHTLEECVERDVICPYFRDDTSKHMMKL